MIGVTKRQAELLDYIEVYQQHNGGVAPSFEEMKDALGLKSKSGVHRLITSLEERGLISRIPDRARAIRTARLPEYGLQSYSTGELVAELERREQAA